MNFIKKIFGLSDNFNSFLNKNNVTQEELNELGDISVELEINESNKEFVSQLKENKDLQISEGPSQLLGGETLQFVAATITVLDTLWRMSKYVGSKELITLTTSQGKQKMTIKDAIMFIISLKK